MKLDIDKANRITLNLLKDTLQIQSSHTDFLKMLFPDSLQYHDEQSLLDFLFDADTTYQNKRSIFINGNITKKKNSAYSRAHQMELSFIAKQLNYTSCFKEMVQLLTHSFPELVTSTLTALIDKDIENYPSDFYTALIHCIEKTSNIHCSPFWCCGLFTVNGYLESQHVIMVTLLQTGHKLLLYLH